MSLHLPASVQAKIQEIQQSLSFKEIVSKKFKWESRASEVIREKLTDRIKLRLKNDWKIAFYQSKLTAKGKLIRRLKKQI